jgi:hypothetical protein
MPLMTEVDLRGHYQGIAFPGDMMGRIRIDLGFHPVLNVGLIARSELHSSRHGVGLSSSILPERGRSIN